MKRIFIAVLSLVMFGLSVFAQTDRSTRPRVAVTPTPAPQRSAPVIQNDSSAPGAAKRPPVLTGRINSPSQTQNQTANTQDTITADDDEIIRVETNLVTMPVSVLDRNGRFISGLRQQDFQIFENNAQQKIEYFASVEQPFTVVLLIDVSPSTAYQINEIHDAAISFVNQLRKDDKVVVISFDQRIHVLSPLTNNRNVLRNAILQARFGDGTSIYEAIDYTINRQLRGIEGRKAVVIFTDGVDTTSRRANYQSTVRQAEELDALIYPIRYDTYGYMSGQGGIQTSRRRSGRTIDEIIEDMLKGGGAAGSSRAEYELGRRYLEDLARNTGGRTYEATTNENLDAAFAGIAEELRRQYSVGYYPEIVGQKGERRQIRVRVKRQNVVVRAKNSYIVGTNTNQKLAGK